MDPSDNAAIAERLETLASLLDLAGAGTYSVRAYRRAAELIRSTPAPVAELVRTGRVRELRGIGPAIEARLSELVETGRIAEIDELEGEVQPELVGLARLVGLAPQRMVDLGRALGIRSAAELREAAAAGRLREAPGVGPSTEAKILAALAGPRPVPRRALTLNRARALAEAIAAPLDGTVAGDPRRWRDTSERLAVVVAAEAAAPVLDRFATLPEIVAVVERGDDRALGLPYVPPELREAPYRGDPPALVDLTDVRGDVHVHSTWSDGKASVLEMARAARDLGYEYLAICDHTRNVSVVPGLDAADLVQQAEEVAEANELLAPFRVLRGIECDILADGSLDLPDEALAGLEWVQASVHAGQRQSRDQLTRRTLAAVEHPAVRCISHPQGRIINHRPPNAVDLEAVFGACLETGTAVETNGLPDRLDLSAELVREAIDAGVWLTCSTDAHSVRGLGNMRLSVATARRGWAAPENVLNTRPLDELLGAKRG